MKSMRLLIVLTFILYETQCIKGIEPLKIIKTLISKHFQHQPITEHGIAEQEQPILGEENPVIKYENSEDGRAIVEWNNKLFLVSNEPITNDARNGETLEENIKIDSTDADVIPSVNPNLEKNGEQVYSENDPNTAWLLNENTNEKEADIEHDKNEETTLIKGKLCDNIKSIMSKLKSFKKLNKSVTEPCTTVVSTTLEPTTVTKPCTTVVTATFTPTTVTEPTKKTTINIVPSTGTPPICVPDVDCPPSPYIRCPQPWSPYQHWSNNCPPPSSQLPISYRPNVQYVPYPVYVYVNGMKSPTLNNVPYTGGISNYQRFIDYGVLKEIPNYQSPSHPVNTGQMAQHHYNNRLQSSVIYPSHPVSSYVPQSLKPAATKGPSDNLAFPNLGYPTQTMAPIVVHPIDDSPSSALPVEHRDPANEEVVGLNQFSGYVPLNYGQDFKLRGDIPIMHGADSSQTNLYDRRPEGYQPNDRRQIDHDHDKMTPLNMPLIEPSAKPKISDAKSDIGNINVVGKKTSDVKIQ